MKLKPNLPATVFSPPRGYGPTSLPDVGAQSLQSSCFWTKDAVLGAPALNYDDGRLFLGRVDDRMIGYEDNRHIVTIAGSRSGKSACLLIPNLMLYPGSALVIDPKGELAEATAHHRADALGHKVVVLDPFNITTDKVAAYRGGHDPLAELDAESSNLIDDAAVMAEALVIDTGGDAHWTMAARNLLNGLILLARLGHGHRSLSDIRAALTSDPQALWLEMAALGPEPGDDPVLAEALAIIQGQGEGFQLKNDREAPIIISSALEQLAFLQSPAMRALFTSHDIGLEQLKTGADGKPVTIYLVLPAGRVGTHSRWLRLMVTMALAHMERIRAQPKYPVLMVLEEFAALGHLRPVEQAAGFIAGSGVRIWSVLQDLPQLQRHYEKSWETFLGNAGVVQCFSVSDLTTCKYLSERLGETTVEITNKIAANASMQAGGDQGFRREFRTLPLLTPSEIAIEFRRRSDGKGGSAGGSTLVMVPGAHPFVVDRVFHGELTA